MIVAVMAGALTAQEAVAVCIQLIEVWDNVSLGITKTVPGRGTRGECDITLDCGRFSTFDAWSHVLLQLNPIVTVLKMYRLKCQHKTPVDVFVSPSAISNHH